MINRNQVYIAYPKPGEDNIHVAALRAVVSNLKTRFVTPNLQKISDNSFYINIAISCPKENASEVMPALKAFDKQYAEDTDTKVSFEQIANFGKSDDDPTKKVWPIPSSAFSDKSNFRIYKL